MRLQSATVHVFLSFIDPFTNMDLAHLAHVLFDHHRRATLFAAVRYCLLKCTMLHNAFSFVHDISSESSRDGS